MLENVTPNDVAVAFAAFGDEARNDEGGHLELLWAGRIKLQLGVVVER